jgi:hypothetical protein
MTWDDMLQEEDELDKDDDGEGGREKCMKKANT